MEKKTTKNPVQRDKFQIRYEILRTLGENGVAKTRLMNMTFLSWDILNQELDALDQLQLLQKSENIDKRIYLTERGKTFMEKYEKLMEIFDTRKVSAYT